MHIAIQSMLCYLIVISTMFTGAIKLANIDDYITPAQECVKPLMHKANEPVLVEPNILKPSAEGKATVSLTDCLACSGCVTSAQTILIEQMSIRQFKERCKTDKPVLIVSPQSRAAIANHFKIPQAEVLPRLKVFLAKHFNVSEVYETIQAIHMAHTLAFQELQERMMKKKLPLLASECPGWVCYAQKTTSEAVVSLMSSVKSPQQIMASLIRQHKQPKGFLVTVMPCYDKKLEAIRFTGPDDQKEVDLVLATTQLIELIMKPTQTCSCGGGSCECCSSLTNGVDEFLSGNINKQNYQQHYLQAHGAPSPTELVSVNDPKANGYLTFMMKSLKAQDIKQKTVRNSDFIEHSMVVGGEQVKMAQCYGFRNIQTIVRQIKTNKCPYLYVQIMACPMACVNGGGQPKEEGTKPREVGEVVQKELQALPLSSNNQVQMSNASRYLVEYKALEKTITTVINDW